MKKPVKITIKNCSLFDTLATRVNTSTGDDFYYLPFWFKKIKDEEDAYELFSLEEAQEIDILKEFIEDLRNRNKPLDSEFDEIVSNNFWELLKDDEPDEN